MLKTNFEKNIVSRIKLWKKHIWVHITYELRGAKKKGGKEKTR